MSDRKRPREEGTEDDLKKEDARIQRILDIMEIRYNRMQEASARFADLVINWMPPGTMPYNMAKTFQVGRRLLTMEMCASRLGPVSGISDYLRYVNVAVVGDFDQFEKECIENSKQIVQDLIACYRGQVCLLTLANSASLDDEGLNKLIEENPVVGETVFERLQEFRKGPVFKEIQNFFKNNQSALQQGFIEVETAAAAVEASPTHTPAESTPVSEPPSE